MPEMMTAQTIARNVLAADVAELTDEQLAVLIPALLRESSRRTAPEVALLLDAGDHAGAAQAVLARIESGAWD